MLSIVSVFRDTTTRVRPYIWVACRNSTSKFNKHISGHIIYTLSGVLILYDSRVLFIVLSFKIDMEIGNTILGHGYMNSIYSAHGYNI